MSNRAERPSKKLRRLSTDSEGTEEGLDWAGMKTQPRSQPRANRAEKAAAPKNKNE